MYSFFCVHSWVLHEARVNIKTEKNIKVYRRAPTRHLVIQIFQVPKVILNRDCLKCGLPSPVNPQDLFTFQEVTAIFTLILRCYWPFSLLVKCVNTGEVCIIQMSWHFPNDQWMTLSRMGKRLIQNARHSNEFHHSRAGKFHSLIYFKIPQLTFKKLPLVKFWYNIKE